MKKSATKYPFMTVAISLLFVFGFTIYQDNKNCIKIQKQLRIELLNNEEETRQKVQNAYEEGRGVVEEQLNKKYHNKVNQLKEYHLKALRQEKSSNHLKLDSLNNLMKEKIEKLNFYWNKRIIDTVNILNDNHSRYIYSLLSEQGETSVKINAQKKKQSMDVKRSNMKITGIKEIAFRFCTCVISIFILIGICLSIKYRKRRRWSFSSK